MCSGELAKGESSRYLRPCLFQQILKAPQFALVKDLVAWFHWNAEKPILYLIEEAPAKTVHFPLLL